jgi:hypothetical protein
VFIPHTVIVFQFLIGRALYSRKKHGKLIVIAVCTANREVFGLDYTGVIWRSAFHIDYTGLGNK